MSWHNRTFRLESDAPPIEQERQVQELERAIVEINDRRAWRCPLVLGGTGPVARTCLRSDDLYGPDDACDPGWVVASEKVVSFVRKSGCDVVRVVHAYEGLEVMIAYEQRFTAGGSYFGRTDAVRTRDERWTVRLLGSTDEHLVRVHDYRLVQALLQSRGATGESLRKLKNEPSLKVAYRLGGEKALREAVQAMLP